MFSYLASLSHFSSSALFKMEQFEIEIPVRETRKSKVKVCFWILCILVLHVLAFCSIAISLYSLHGPNSGDVLPYTSEENVSSIDQESSNQIPNDLSTEVATERPSSTSTEASTSVVYQSEELLPSVFDLTTSTFDEITPTPTPASVVSSTLTTSAPTQLTTHVSAPVSSRSRSPSFLHASAPSSAVVPSFRSTVATENVSRSTPTLRTRLSSYRGFSGFSTRTTPTSSTHSSSTLRTTIPTVESLESSSRVTKSLTVKFPTTTSPSVLRRVVRSSTTKRPSTTTTRRTTTQSSMKTSVSSSKGSSSSRTSTVRGSSSAMSRATTPRSTTRTSSSTLAPTTTAPVLTTTTQVVSSSSIPEVSTTQGMKTTSTLDPSVVTTAVTTTTTDKPLTESFPVTDSAVVSSTTALSTTSTKAPRQILPIPTNRFKCRILEYNRLCISLLDRQCILVRRRTRLLLELSVIPYLSNEKFASAKEHQMFSESCATFKLFTA